jgi:hypothetical protein
VDESRLLDIARRVVEFRTAGRQDDDLLADLSARDLLAVYRKVAGLEQGT